MVEETVLAISFALAAMLYSSVGHGGASAYLVVMALAGFLPAEMRQTALTMNIAVSALGAALFWRHFKWRLFLPFALTAVPFAWLGGTLAVHPKIFYGLVGFTLFFAAIRLFLPDRVTEVRPLPLAWALLLGGAMGFVSGLVGVGGGIFLTPLLILCRWASAREAAAVSALFICANSLAGLAGLHVSGNAGLLPSGMAVWLSAAVGGGVVGAYWGSRKARPVWLRPALGTVLLIASAKFAGQALL